MKSILVCGDVMRKALVAGVFACVVYSPGALAVNDGAAEDLAKAGKCFRCHSLDKAKKAPSYKRIAQKYKGKPDAEATLLKHLSGKQSVKVEDGGDEEHEPPPAKDPEDLKNLVQWILSKG